jgi:hypothetical protein
VLLLGVVIHFGTRSEPLLLEPKHNLCLILRTGIKFYLFQTGLGTGFKLFFVFLHSVLQAEC